MRSVHLLILFILSGIVFSCSNKIDIENPVFSISTEKTTYKVGEAVQFSIEGRADYITFYPGDKGHNYEFINRTRIDNSTPVLNFTSRGAYGPPERNLRLLISDNFSGKITAEDIMNANWNDISNRAIFSSGTEINSGNIELTDYVNSKTVYLAFHYVGEGNSNIAQKSWWITNFSVNNIDDKGEVYPVVKDMSGGGWLQYSFAGDSRKWSISATQLFLGAGANEPSNDDWVITKSLKLADVLPDTGIPIKNLATQTNSCKYSYSTPGTYKVIFSGVNENIYGRQQSLRSVEITIVP